MEEAKKRYTVASSTTFRTLAILSPCFNAWDLEKYDRVALIKLVPNGATEPPARGDIRAHQAQQHGLLAGGVAGYDTYFIVIRNPSGSTCVPSSGCQRHTLSVSRSPRRGALRREGVKMPNDYKSNLAPPRSRKYAHI